MMLQSLHLRLRISHCAAEEPLRCPTPAHREARAAAFDRLVKGAGLAALDGRELAIENDALSAQEKDRLRYGLHKAVTCCRSAEPCETLPQ